MAHGGMLSARDRATGEVRIISEVVSGEACHCQCAECGAVLVARKGKIRAHHFAHKSGSDSQMRACQETALHNAAKRLLAHHLERLMIPTKALNRHTERFVQPEPTTCAFSETLTPASRTLSLAGGEIEPALPGSLDIRPDARNSSAELGPVYFEVHVTHPVPADKTAVYREMGLWVLEIDLSECDPGSIGLQELVTLVESDAPRTWLSWQVPEEIRGSIAAYDRRVAYLREQQHVAHLADLGKPVLDRWQRAPSWPVTALRYRAGTYPVHVRMPVPEVEQIKGFWVTSSIAGLRLPVFTEPRGGSLLHMLDHYRQHRDRPLTCVVLERNGATLHIGDEDRLQTVAHWLLQVHAVSGGPPMHQAQAYRGSATPPVTGQSLPEPQHTWTTLWADPPITLEELPAEGVYCSDVTQAFAEFCAQQNLVNAIVIPRHKAIVGRTDFLLQTGHFLGHSEVYTALRRGIGTSNPLPARLILEDAGYSRSLDITQRITQHNGILHLTLNELHVPLAMTIPNPRDSVPIHLVPGLSYADDSALFRASNDTLTTLLYQHIEQLDRDPGQTALSAFVKALS